MAAIPGIVARAGRTVDAELRRERTMIRTDVVWRAALLLVCSNVFMTFAWYAHLRNLADRPWYVAAIVSWGIALFEYLLQVPANRIGYTAMSLAQLKIMQEAITLSVFVPFAVLYMRQPLKLDYLWAALCIMGAVYFIFRSPVMQMTGRAAAAAAALLLAGSRAGRAARRRSLRERARDLGIPLDGTPGPLDAITDVRGVTVGHTTLIVRGRPPHGRQGAGAHRCHGDLPAGPGRPVARVRRLVQPQRQRRDDRHGVDRRLRAALLPHRHHQHQQRRDGARRAHRVGRRPVARRPPLLPARGGGDVGRRPERHLRLPREEGARRSPRWPRPPRDRWPRATWAAAPAWNAWAYKGGIGTASRRLPARSGGFTVGALVQCNFGLRRQLRIAGDSGGRRSSRCPSPATTPTSRSTPQWRLIAARRRRAPAARPATPSTARSS